MIKNERNTFYSLPFFLSFPGDSVVKKKKKNLPAKQEMRIQSLGQEDPPGEGNGTSIFFSEKSHGQRSMVGYSLWGHKKLDTT